MAKEVKFNIPQVPIPINLFNAQWSNQHLPIPRHVWDNVDARKQKNSDQLHLGDQGTSSSARESW